MSSDQLVLVWGLAGLVGLILVFGQAKLFSISWEVEKIHNEVEKMRRLLERFFETKEGSESEKE